MNRKENKLKFSLNGLTPTRSSKFAIKKMLGELRTTALPRCERANAFTLAEGGQSPLLYGDEVTQGSPRLEKRGFTLAEVLITLGVIGVVAAMTMPTLINEHRISQWETALKRDYTVLSQGFRKLMADYGCDTLECTGIFSTITDEEGNEVGDQDKLDEAMRSVFQIVKSYKSGERENRGIKYLKGVYSITRQFYDIPTNQYRMVLNDGAIVYFSHKSVYCSPYGSTKKCSFITIDVNGLIPPNTLGKDVFALGNLMNNGEIVPDTSRKWEEYSSNHSSYWRNSSGQCGTPNTKLKDETISYINGQNCLARIMENNWKMDYLH